MPFIVKNASDAKQFVSQLAARRETGEGQEGELDRYIRYLGYEIERQNSLPQDKRDSFYIMNLSTLLNHAVRLNRLVGESVEALANNDRETARRQLQAAAATAERMNMQLQAISTSFDADRTRGADNALRLNLTTPLEAVRNPPWRKYGALGGYYQAPEMPEAIREGGEPEIDDDMDEQEIREAQSRANDERRQQWDWVIGQSFVADPPASSHEEVVTLLARSVAASLLRDDRPPQKYDKKKLDRFTEEVKRNPNFQFLTRDEATSVGYMTQPGALEMLRDATMGLYMDGTRRDRESVNNSLDSLGSAMRQIIPERNRSNEWKNFHDSLSNYTREMVNDQGLPVRPGEPGAHPRYGAIRSPYRVGDMKEDGKPFTVPERVDEVFTGIEKYIKGKKSLRSTPEEQERFDLAMDALAIVAKTSPAAKARAEAIVARINYVRTHRPWFQKPQPTINLEDYGRERGRDAIRRRLVREGLSEEKANLLVPRPRNLDDLVQPAVVNEPVQPAQEGNGEPPVQEGNEGQPGQEENEEQPVQEENEEQPVQEGNVPVPPVQEGNGEPPVQEGNVPVPPVQEENGEQPVQEENGEQPALEENAQPVEIREIVESGELTGIYREKPEEMTALPVRTITGQIERLFDGLDNPDEDEMRNAFVKALALDGLELYHSTDKDGNGISVVDYEKFKEEENRLRDSREIAVLMETVMNDEALAEKLIMNQEGEQKQAKDLPELTRQLKELLPAARQKAEEQQKAEEEQKELLRQQEQSEIMKNPELPHHIKNARSVKQIQNRILDEINALSDEDEPDIGRPLSKVLALSKCTLYRAKTKQGNYVTAIDRDELNQIAQGVSDLPEFQEFIDSFDNDPDRLSEFLENEDGDPVTFEEFVGSLKDAFQQFREERAREKAEEEQQNLQSEEEQAHMEEQDALDGQEAVPQPEEEAEEAEEMLACDVLNSDLAKKLPEKADLQNPVEITKLQSDVRSCFLSYTAGEKSDNALAKGIALGMINAYRMDKNGRTIAVVDKEELEKATHNVKSSKAFQTLTSRLKDDTQYAENFADDKQLMEQMGVELHIKLPMAKMTKKLVEEFQNYEKIVGEAAPEEQAQEQGQEQAQEKEQAQKPLTALDVESAEQILSLPQGNAANVTTLSDLRKEATDFRTALYHGRVDVVYQPEGGAAINPWEVTEKKLSRLLAMGEMPLERQTIGGQVFAVVDEDKLQKRADEIRKDKHFRVMIERMEKDRNYTQKLTQDWRNNLADFSIFYQNIKQSYDKSLGLADELGRQKIERRRVENREKWKAAHQRWQEQKAPELPEGPVELVPLGHDGIPLPPKEGPAIVPYQIAPGVFVPHPELIPPEPVEIVRTNPIAYDPAKVPAEQLPVKKLAHPAQVRGTVLLLNSMSEKFSKGKTASAFAKDPVTVVARAIALKGMTVYRGEKDGKPCAVVNGALLRKRVDALKENPVVQAMAKELAEKPEYRRKLTSEIRDFPDAERLADAITEEYNARSLEYKAQQNDRLVSGGKTPSAVACIADGVKLEDLPQKKLRNPVPFNGTLNSYKYHAQAIAQGKYPKQLMKDPVAQVAKVLALSQLAGYRGEVNGRGVPVVDGDILSKKLETLTADPAVQKLAEKMADPEFRKTLATAENPQGAPEPVSGAKMIENICSQYDAISKDLAAEKARQEAQKAQEDAQKAQKEVQDALKQGQQKEADRDIKPPAGEKQDVQQQLDGNRNGPIIV